MYISFNRGGTEIYNQRAGVEDDDQPDLVGVDILLSMGNDALRNA